MTNDRTLVKLTHFSVRGCHPFRIDSGAIVAARADTRFGSDNFFVGGATGTADTPGGRGRQPVLVDIAATDRRDIVATFRSGSDFRYRVPVAKGRYRVTLSFVEPREAKGARVFGVTANGTPVLDSYDIHTRAGGLLTATRETFPITVTGDTLDLHFVAQRGEAIVSAIEIEPVTD